MKTAERTRIAFARGTPDRVPIHCWLGLPLIRELKPKDKSMTDMLEWWIDDPMGSIVQMQQDLGLDPMITTYSQHIGEHEIWPRMLFPRPFETDTWSEKFHVSATGEGWREHTHLIKTPDGDLDYSYRTEDGFGTSCHDYLLKGDEPERKLAALKHFPPGDLYDMSVMKSMVEKVGDEAWWLHHVIGPWDMAAEVRGLVNLSMDIYDRPQFVHDLMRVCTDWLLGFYKQLGQTGIHSISMNETWVGVGVARQHFLEFMQPYETECVTAAHEAGYLVSFHNCGRATLFLEDIADTGPDAVETLTSDRSSGDVDLADAKARIGDRVCLFGGFNEHLLNEGDEATVKQEVARCLDAAMDGGGYVLRSTGQIFFTKPGLIEVMCETARELGTYR
jgi:uroporphyrinogen decarboxylase-like protein